MKSFFIETGLVGLILLFDPLLATPLVGCKVGDKNQSWEVFIRETEPGIGKADIFEIRSLSTASLRTYDISIANFKVTDWCQYDFFEPDENKNFRLSLHPTGFGDEFHFVVGDQVISSDTLEGSCSLSQEMLNRLGNCRILYFWRHNRDLD